MLIITYALSRPIVGVGLCSTRKALRGHKVLAGEQCSPLRDEIAKAHIILHKPESYACRGLHRRPANGAACFCYSRSSPIRAKTFPYNKKKTRKCIACRSYHLVHHQRERSENSAVQCTVFSDRSPRGECKLHSSAARARPVGDGAPCASLSITHNAKKRPASLSLAGLISWCTISGSV